MGPGSTSLPEVGEGTVDLGQVQGPRVTAEMKIPDKVGRYQIEAKIGEGGMGSVYRAVDEAGNEVALKLLRAVLVNEEGFAERFRREAEVAASVRHDNVVRLMDHGVADGHHYMAFQLLTGGDVGDLIKRRGALTEAKAFGILRDAAKGIGAIDRAGLVHRDIKPGNIFLDQGGQVRIGDLGLARHTDGDDRMTMTGIAMGTPAYMSPEHVQGVGDIDIRTDLYALGATLYKMLTGEDPYIGDTLYMVTSQVLNDPTPDPRALDPQISAEAAAIVRKAMAKKREDRYQTADELIQDLDRALAGQRLLYAPVDFKAPKAVAGDDTRRHVAQAASMGGGAKAGRRGLPLHHLRVVVIAVTALGLLYGLSRVPDLLVVPEEPGPAPQDWALDQGKDEHGYWAKLPFPGTTMTMRYIPHGTFVMGSPPEEEYRKDVETPHEVTISQPFWMAEQEVTQAMWNAIMDTSPSHFDEAPKRPVEMVTWDQAVTFCEKLSATWPGMTARLPTEAEWEYACRAGLKGPYGKRRQDPHLVGHFAPGPLRHAWWDASDEGMDEQTLLDHMAAAFEEHADDVRFQTKIGKSLDPNPWGLYDMHGNVAEWCLDGWMADLDYLPEPAVDPLEEVGDLRIARGGSWYEPEWRGRAASRYGYPPGYADFNLGFRFVIEHVARTSGTGDDDADAP